MTGDEEYREWKHDLLPEDRSVRLIFPTPKNITSKLNAIVYMFLAGRLLPAVSCILMCSIQFHEI